MGSRGPVGKKAMQAIQTKVTSLKCPANLKGVAAAEWKRLVKALAASGLLHESDRGMIELACEAYAAYHETKESIGGNRFVIRQRAMPNGTLLNDETLPHPGLAHEAKMLQIRRSVLESLGLCPTKRARKIESNEPESDGLTDLLRARASFSID